MSALKLTATASSVYVRTAIPSTGPKTKPALALLWSNRNILYHHQRGCRITSCAHTLSPAHVIPPSKTLGFAFWVRHKSPCFSSVRDSSSSSVEKSGVSGSSPRPGVVVEMGSGMKDRDGSENEVLLQKERVPPSVQDSQLQSKLLTLPTILTLGRVAAVPLLVASMFIFVVSVWIRIAYFLWVSGILCRGSFTIFFFLVVIWALAICWSVHYEWRVFGFVFWNLNFHHTRLWYHVLFLFFLAKYLNGQPCESVTAPLTGMTSWVWCDF